jgi:hypothetical protein
MRFIFVVFIAVLVLGTGRLEKAYAQQKKVTVHGQLVEVTSYVREGIKPTSPARKEIIMESVRKGSPLAILEKGSEKLYLLSPVPSDTAFVKKLTGYLGVAAFVKGPVYRRGGVNLLVVEDIGKSLK